ncbi:MAG: hypothetical protein AB1346_11490 [Thermodesulfobacteriota bacterium]
MAPEKKNWTAYLRIYLYLFALGLLLFGVFAVYFRTYNHPFYGRINLGEYHRWIGAASFVAGIAFLRYIRSRR